MIQCKLLKLLNKSYCLGKTEAPHSRHFFVSHNWNELQLVKGSQSRYHFFLWDWRSGGGGGAAQRTGAIST